MLVCSDNYNERGTFGSKQTTLSKYPSLFSFFLRHVSKISILAILLYKVIKECPIFGLFIPFIVFRTLVFIYS